MLDKNHYHVLGIIGNPRNTKKEQNNAINRSANAEGGPLAAGGSQVDRQRINSAITSRKFNELADSCHQLPENSDNYQKSLKLWGPMGPAKCT